MQALIFDPFSGASGDMIIASLIDLGSDESVIRDIMESTADVSVSINRMSKRGISAVDVKVTAGKEYKRSYYELLDIIRSASLPKGIEKSVFAIFSLLGDAESKVHGQPLDELHFHEIGQNDALADVVGACTAINEFEFHQVYCTPITVGSGFIESEHGKLPVPAPATLEILKASKMKFRGNNISQELLTPTGAAILAHFAYSIDSFPQSLPLSIGYGAGDVNTPHPNVLRTVLAEVDDALIQDSIEVLETNVDDVTGEVLGNLIEELLTMGARDVCITPTTMKKGRSGHIIQVIAKSEDASKFARKIIKETGSLGVRVIPTRHRLIADRRMDSVKIIINNQKFEIAVKIAQDTHGSLLNISAEFEDCKKVATRCEVPLKDVIRMAEGEAWERFG
ncbi:MAG: nickel pincer cofactor biosynthesis protein LarC [Methanosarcinaceae archaeon]|nr:nickel pincer cofactor biosynthesis protein LarC [Methanosarcinaceae archaeon]